MSATPPEVPRKITPPLFLDKKITSREDRVLDRQRLPAGAHSGRGWA